MNYFQMLFSQPFFSGYHLWLGRVTQWIYNDEPLATDGARLLPRDADAMRKHGLCCCLVDGVMSHL